MTVVLNDPATLADLVRFGPVPHDVEAAARQQLPFENKVRALTAYTENRGSGRQSDSIVPEALVK